ncbi:PTS fructose-like transporter subunit IIB, partial [uncultured Pseudacidovorax sp.]|uniref:PTS fructose-like transporter subunit IIB n=1 Tax=uncultured Pseudacidovorax sp. TaxID=679313 RepID=UPI0026009A20
MASLIAIAASQAGPAHSFMLGEVLADAARQLGHDLRIQVQSSLGTQGKLSPAELAQASAVIVAADAGAAVDRSALPAGRVLDVAPEAVFRDAGAVLRQALALAGAPAAAPAAAAPVAAAASRPLKIVAITSCPTGVAHTFMAAEALEQGAKALGHQIQVETQGSVGAQNTLGADTIAEADLVLIAADTQVDRSRFAGKRLHSSGTKAAIHDAPGLIAKAQAEAAVWGGEGAAAAASTVAAGAKPAAKVAATGPYKHLMTGVSFMLPFVVAGGLLIALAFAVGGIDAMAPGNAGTLGYALGEIGAKAAFALIVPALAGYIAFSIADRPGIAPGMIGGMLAANLNAGFLGGIAAGFIAGYTVSFLSRSIRLPKNLEGLK